MKRNDALPVYDIPLFNKIFPFMLRRRCDSLVYYSCNVDVTETINYVREYNSHKPEVRMKFFYVFCAAVLRTIAMKPELNRFIYGRRYWKRNELSMNFIVKEDMSEDSPEVSNPLYFDPKMTLNEYMGIINDYIEKSRENSADMFTDKTISFFMHFPYWLIGFVVKVFGFMDRFGFLPKFVREADGLHTSVFISNLGSIGLMGSSPHHHLYEWGTTSMFCTLGGMHREKEYDEAGHVSNVRTFVEVGLTLDERVSSGYYLIKCMACLQDLLMNPKELEKVPDVPAPPLTKKQWKAKIKAERKAFKNKADSNKQDGSDS